MTVTLEWPQIAFFIALVISWTAFLYGIIRMLVLARITSLEARIAETHTLATAIQAANARMQAELPMLYERREDATRAYTVINAKLDRLYELWTHRT